MRTQKNNIFFGIDWLLVFLYLILIAFGWMNIYAASITETHQEIFDLTTEYGKQLIWIGLSCVLIIAILFIDSKFYEKFSSIFYLLSLISLVGLFLFGKNINGATSWYALGSATIQPSEFAKAATAMAVAKLLSDKQFDLKLLKNQIKVFVIIFLPAIFITLQPDPGSALIYTAFFFVLYREGLPIYYIATGFFAILLFILTLSLGYKTILISVYAVISLLILYFIIIKKRSLKFEWGRILSLLLIIGVFIFSVDYVYNNIFEQRHRDRFSILLGQNTDTRGIGYNTNQSVITISSGGLTGKGYLEGDRTQGKFVPEQSTDYIFSTIGEEWGFLGSSFVIILFMVFLLRILHLAEQQKTKFSRVYGYSIATIFFFHFMINIGMVIGLLPTVGIPLPFFSYGGSSLWGFTILLFIFIKLDANKTYEW